MAIFRANQIVEPKIMEIGKIYKGSKKKPGVSKDNKPIEIQGNELEYYRFEAAERLKKVASVSGKHNSLYDELMLLYENIPDNQRVPILFPYPNAAQVWRASNQKWQTFGKDNRCIRYCDGITVTNHLDDEKAGGSPYAHIPCAAEPGMKDCPKKCVPTGILRFTIPALNYPGEVLLTTHSIRDITTIPRNLETYKGYDLREIPFLLVKTQQKCPHTTPQGKRFNQLRWFCHIEIEPTFGAELLSNRQQNSLSSSSDPIPERPKSADVPTLIKPETRSKKQRFLQRILELTDKLQNLRSEPVTLPLPPDGMDEAELTTWGMELRLSLEQELQKQIKRLWVEQRNQGIEIPEAELGLDLASLKLNDLEKVYEIAAIREEAIAPN